MTKDEYQWLDGILEKLIFSIGENENHPLAPLMEFIIQLITNYEQAYVPKLTDRFPELAEGTPIETASKSEQPASNIPKQSASELAAHAFFSIGFLLYLGNRVEGSISAYDTAIVLKPDFWEASYNCGIARYDLRQYPEAMFNFNRVIELNYNLASAYHNRGTLRSELNDHEGAMADFNKAIILKLEHADAYNKLGITKSKLGQRASAIVDFGQAIKLNPKHADAYYNRGYTSYQLGNFQAAINDFDKTIELDQSNYTVYYYRGAARLLLDNSQAAIDDFDKAIALKQDIAEVYYCRGVAKNQLGNSQVAIADFENAKLDLQTALELTEQKNNTDLKTFVENQLQQLDNSTS